VYLKRDWLSIGIVVQGLECVQAPGEGEAACAALESIGELTSKSPYLFYLGLVDGCITRDSDVLAFGGQTIYKTFSLSVKFCFLNVLVMLFLDEIY